MLIISVFVNAQNSELEKVQEKYFDSETVSADFRETFTVYSANTSSTVEGKIYLKKKNKFRVEITGTSIISNGESVWNYNKKANQVVINPVDDQNQIFDIENLLNSFSSDYKIESDNKKREIVCTAKNEDLHFKTVVIRYTKSYSVSEMELTDSLKNSYKIELKNFEYNKNLEDSYFEFSPPEGSRIVDLR